MSKREATLRFMKYQWEQSNAPLEEKKPQRFQKAQGYHFKNVW